MKSETGESSAAKQQRLIETDPDFILLRRFGYSLKQALKKYPEGLPENLVAQALGKSPAWVTRHYNNVVKKLQSLVAPKQPSA